MTYKLKSLNSHVILSVGIGMAILGTIMKEIDAPFNNKTVRKHWNVGSNILKYSGIGLTGLLTLSTLCPRKDKVTVFTEA